MALQDAAENVQREAGIPLDSAATQQVCALSQIAQLAEPEPPAAPLAPPVPVVPPVPVPLMPPVPVVPPVPVPLAPPVPPPHAGTVSRQASRSAQVVLVRQAFPALMIALWLEQAPPVLVVAEATQPGTHSVVAAEVPASGSHSATSLSQPCVQRLMTLSALGELDPHPCTAPSTNPAARTDPITAETVFLDIARYLLLVCGRTGKVSRPIGGPLLMCDPRSPNPLRRLSKCAPPPAGRGDAQAAAGSG